MSYYRREFKEKSELVHFKKIIGNTLAFPIIFISRLTSHPS